MARKPALHDADDLLTSALDRAVAALNPPESDAAVVALAHVLARSIDRMSDAERASMLGQTVPPLLRTLVELERRAEMRRTASPRRGPSKLDALREAHAKTYGRRGAL